MAGPRLAPASLLALLLLLLLAGAGAAAWLAATRGGPHAGSEPTPQKAAEPALPATAAAVPGEPGAAATAANPGAARERIDGTDRGQGLLVEVRDARTQATVADAEVGVFADDAGSNRIPDLEQPGWRLPDEQDLAGGSWRRTDAAGRCTVPRPAGLRGRIVARHGRSVGERALAWSMLAPVPVVVAIAADPAVRVRVVDPSGTPVAGVPVALRSRYQEKGHPIDFLVLAGRTDEHGTLDLTHVAARLGVGMPSAGVPRVSVCLAEPGLQEIEREFAWQAPPDVPLVLVLPPTGGLAVTLPEELGPVRFRVQLRQVAPVDLQPPFWAWPPRGGHEVRFPRVAVGARFVAQAVVGAMVLDSEPGGPMAPGQVAELRVGDGALLVRGRAVAGGAPLADRALRFVARGEGVVTEFRGRSYPNRTHGGTLTTRSDGTFTLPLDRRWAGAELRELTLQPVDEDPLAAPRLCRRGPLTLPDRSALDLGDCECAPLPLLVHGRVRWTDGAPVGEDDWFFFASGTTPDGRATERGEVLTLRSRDRFAVHAIVAVARGELVFRSDGALERRLPFDAGDAVDVALERAGEVVASVLLPAECPAVAVEGFLLPAGGSPRIDLRADADGSRARVCLWQRPVAPGRYDVQIGLRAQPQSRMLVPGVEVRAGARSVDPRLQDLVLPGRLVEVRCTDAATGAAIFGMGRLLLDRPESGRWRGIDMMGGVARLLVQGEPEAFVGMECHRPEMVVLAGAEVVVPLVPSAAQLTVRLPAPEVPLPADVVLRVAVEPVLTADEARIYETPATSGRVGDLLGRSRQEKVIAAGGAGELRLVQGRWTLRLSAVRGERRAPVECAPGEIEIAGDREVALQVGFEQWRRAVVALR